MIRTAFVLGAGLGTRLKSLTARRPKPLIPVANVPLIRYAFDHLLGAGISRLVVNTHWRAECYSQLFPEPSYREVSLTFREEAPEVLETAGGIWNVRDLLGDEPFIVYNGDILTDLPLGRAIAAHTAASNEVTMVLRSRGGPLQVAFDGASGRVLNIGGRVAPVAAGAYLFTGVYIVEPSFLRRIPAAIKISVVPIFCEMIREQARLGGVVLDEGCWWDLGSREQYLEVHRTWAEKGAPWLHPAAQIAANAQLTGATAVGEHARIGAGAQLRDCIVWEHAEVAAGAVLERCIVTSGACAEGAHVDMDFAPVQ